MPLTREQIIKRCQEEEQLRNLPECLDLDKQTDLELLRYYAWLIKGIHI